MGIIKAFTGAITSTFADQWKEIIIPSAFDEHTMVVPGLLKSKVTGRGSNQKSTDGIISSGSKIFVPENTAAVIFNQGGIENVITIPGGYIYKKGEESIFNNDGFNNSINKQVKNRVEFGGISSSEVRIAYVNLREIRDIKFGTKGALIYNDNYYKCDFEIYSFGSFSIQITQPETLIRNFVPANTLFYTIDDEKARGQLISDFLQSFNTAVSSLSSEFRITQLPQESNRLSEQIRNDTINAGSWEERFGFCIVKVSIENIEFSKQSKQLVEEYNKKIMEIKPYEDMTKETSENLIKHKIADGVKEKNGGIAGTILGLRLLKGNKNRSKSIDSQTKELKKLKSLLDSGIITEEEYIIKKKEILGIE